MPDSIYASAATIMRYFFVVAIIYIILSITAQSVREYAAIRRVKHYVEGVFSGTIRFLAPDDFLNEAIELTKVNNIGSSNGCHISIGGCGLKKRHARIVQTRRGAYLLLFKKAAASVNGEMVEARKHPLKDGDEVAMEEVRFVYNTRLKEGADEEEGD